MQATGIDPTQPDPGVVFTVAPHAFLLFAAILSIFLARRAPKLWKPAAVFVCGIALASWLGWGLVALLPPWTPTRPPFTGIFRVIFHASQGCRLAGPILLYGFARWEAGFVVRPDAVEVITELASLFLAVLGGCILGYPGVMRGNPDAVIDPLRLLYAGADVIAVVVSARLMIRWAHVRSAYHWRRWTAAPMWILSMLIVGNAIMILFGSYRLGLWGHAYRVEQAGLIPLWGLVCGVLGTALLRRPEP